MEKNYFDSFEDIDKELKVLNLERQIAAQELQNLGMEVKESFSLNQILSATMKSIKDFGVYYLIKRVLR